MSIALAAGCGGDEEDGIPAGAQELQFSSESPDGERWTFFDSGFEHPLQVVIRDEEAWRAFWVLLWAHQVPRPRAPAIDFASEMILAVAIGWRPSGGYRAEITGVHQLYADLFVSYREVQPDPGTCVVTDAVTTPVALARVPRTRGRVFFLGSIAVHRCE